MDLEYYARAFRSRSAVQRQFAVGGVAERPRFFFARGKEDLRTAREVKDPDIAGIDD
jgi:hypothetical protein